MGHSQSKLNQCQSVVSFFDRDTTDWWEPISKSEEEGNALGRRRVVTRARPIVTGVRSRVVVRLGRVVIIGLGRINDRRTAVASPVVVIVMLIVGANRSGAKAGNHEGKADGGRDPAYPVTQFNFRFGRYFHNCTPSRNRLQLHLLAAVCLATPVLSRPRNSASALFFCASDMVL